MYKLVEQETGKKIVPDTTLTRHSLALHKKKGLGKSFGMDSYQESLTEAIYEALDREGIPKAGGKAKELFKRLKDRIHGMGLTDFKSIAPILGKAGVGVAGGLVSLASEAADSEEEGSKQEEQALERDKADKRIADVLGPEKMEKYKEEMGKPPYARLLTKIRP